MGDREWWYGDISWCGKAVVVLLKPDRETDGMLYFDKRNDDIGYSKQIRKRHKRLFETREAASESVRDRLGYKLQRIQGELDECKAQIASLDI